MQDEAKWASEIAGGDRAAFGRFVDEFGPRVHRLTRRFARSECDAEDLTQEIFVALFQSAGSFRGGSKLSTWVYRVAMNHCLRHREKAGREINTSTCSSDAASAGADGPEEAADREADPARQAARREMRQQVRLSLDELSDGHRAVVVLHEMHGLSYSECAQALGIPLGTVKSRLFNAFRHLRGHLAPYVLDAEPDPPQPQASAQPLNPQAPSPQAPAAAPSAAACGEAPR